MPRLQSNRKLSARVPIKAPTFLTVIKAIALAEGKLKGHQYYLTKKQMIAIAKAVLKVRKS